MRFISSEGAITAAPSATADEGYTVQSFSPGARTWSHSWVTSPYMNEQAPTRTPTLTGRTLEVSLLVEGGDLAEMRGRIDALLAVVEAPHWVLESDGQSWDCYPADSNQLIPSEPRDSAAFREVNLSIPARNPTPLTEES